MRRYNRQLENLKRALEQAEEETVAQQARTTLTDARKEEIRASLRMSQQQVEEAMTELEERGVKAAPTSWWRRMSSRARFAVAAAGVGLVVSANILAKRELGPARVSRSSDPAQIVYPIGDEQSQGLSIRVRGKSHGAIEVNEAIYQMAHNLERQLGIPLNVNLNQTDNLSSLSDQEIEQLVMRAL